MKAKERRRVRGAIGQSIPEKRQTVLVICLAIHFMMR